MEDVTNDETASLVDDGIIGEVGAFGTELGTVWLLVVDIIGLLVLCFLLSPLQDADL